MEVGMATRRNPKVVEGVHFVWVPKYKGTKLPPHWVSMSHRPSQVRVFEPRKQHGHKPKDWTVVFYKPGVFPTSEENKFYLENHRVKTQRVWKKAAKLAKRKLE
jgi:hypothetical protein